MPLAFRTSIIGRVGHVVMTVVSAAPAALIAGGLVVGVPSTDDLAFWAGAVIFLVACTLGTLYCVAFALKRGDRIILSSGRLVYHGIFRSISIEWPTITELWLARRDVNRV